MAVLREMLNAPTGAIFDPSGTYRYSLWRVWSSAPRVTFILLNPSTADAERSDPTLRRCLGFARDWGYGSLEMVNLFAYRSTQPAALRQVADPVGPDNDRHILAAAGRSPLVVVGWGNGGVLMQRDRAVLQLLSGSAADGMAGSLAGLPADPLVDSLADPPLLHCLGITQTGQPRHPLYARQDTPLMDYTHPVGSG